MLKDLIKQLEDVMALRGENAANGNKDPWDILIHGMDTLKLEHAILAYDRPCFVSPSDAPFLPIVPFGEGD